MGFWEEGDLVTPEENLLLHTDFTKDDAKEAVFFSYAEGAPGLDGFPFLFYQQFWDTIKFDRFDLFRDFNNDKLYLYRLNFAILTLIPKEPDAVYLKKYRPIALANCSFKFFAKACTNKLSCCAERLISCNKTAFIKGRYILDSAVSAHEIIHEIFRKMNLVSF